MRVMKDSGIEWIGKIPEGWDTPKIKLLFCIVAGATPKSASSDYWDGDIAWITPADYKTEDVYVSCGRKNITEQGLKSCATSLVPSGSIIFSKRAPVGLVAINASPLCTNQGCLSCIPQKQTNVKFYYYSMSTFTGQFDLYASGTTFKEISAETFADFKLPFPSIDEQTRIADYLDAKCAEIDALIAAKEKTNALLKERRQSIIYEAVTKGLDLNAPMKDSGIEWIGEIPQGWEIYRLKNCAVIDAEKLSDKTNENFEFHYIDISSVTEYGGIGTTAEMTFGKSPSRARMIVRTGDTIISTVRTYLKAIAFIESKDSYICSTGFCVVTPQEKLFPKYGFYLLQSDYFVQKIVSSSVGVSYPAINSSEIGNIKIAIPFYEEQILIANYLNTKCAEIDSLIFANNTTIEKLKEYRQSVIFEAVTGKVEI